jgi:GDP-L-fucose synthase
MAMKIVILGASGFIGRNLYSRLISEYPQHEIIGTYNNNVVEGMVRCDFLNSVEVVNVLTGADIVYMLCAKTFGADVMCVRPEILVRDNVVINANILNACLVNNVRQVVFLSSSTVYQESYNTLEEKDLDLNENPFGLYLGVGWVKRYTEKMCEFYSTLGVSCTVLRPVSIYGEGDKIGQGSHFLPAIIKRFIENPLKVIVWGNGSAVKNLLYIQDAVDCLINAGFSNRQGYDVFNICSDDSYSIREIVRKIIDILDCDTDVVFDKTKPEAIPYRKLSRNKYDSYFGRMKQTSIQLGLRNTIYWIKGQLC